MGICGREEVSDIVQPSVKHAAGLVLSQWFEATHKNEGSVYYNA